MPPGFDYLVADFADITEHHQEKTTGDKWIWTQDEKVLVPQKFIDRYPGSRLYECTLNRCNSRKKEYRLYGNDMPNVGYDLVIHCRREVKWGRSNRNWPLSNYQKLVAILNTDCASIGSKAGAFYVSGTKDLRGVPMDVLCNVIYNSKLVIGCSSGPIHLASHCRTPHVVWTDSKYQKAIRGTNRERYEKIWNPFRTKCKVIDHEGWNPKVKTVIRAVKEMS